MTSAYSFAPSNPFIVRSASSYSEIDGQRDVFESQRHHIFSVAYYMTGDEREAETILGSTFIHAFQLHKKPSAAELDTALIAEHHQRLSLDQTPPAQAENTSLGTRNVRRTDLEEAIQDLPARERLCFLLHDVEGYNPARIAGLLETTESEVKRTLLSARIRMRNVLAAQRSAGA
jgi:RNA polymerase sigma factor (sigma-70 family)